MADTGNTAGFGQFSVLMITHMVKFMKQKDYETENFRETADNFAST